LIGIAIVIALYNAAADFVCYNGLIQLITDPTRFNNILDVVFCSDALSCEYINMTLYPPIGNSDHNVAVFEVSLTLAVHSGTCAAGFARPDYSRADWNGIDK